MKKIIRLIIIMGSLFLVSCGVDSTNKYRVTFIGLDGKVILEKRVDENTSIDYPDAPFVDGYLFIGWDKDIQEVNENVVIKAIYEKKESKVEFIDNLGNKIKIEYYSSNDKIVYPKPIELEGYHFTKWDQIIESTNDDIVITAIYEKNEYTITFNTMFGDLITSKKYLYQDQIIYPEPLELEGYEFIGWDKEILIANNNEVITANYKKNEVDISLSNVNITNQDSQIIINGNVINKSFDKINNIIVNIDNVSKVINYESQDEIEIAINTNYEISKYLNIKISVEVEKFGIIDLYEEEYLLYLPIKFNNYVSYLETISLDNLDPINEYINSIDFTKINKTWEFTNAIYGGFRNTNEMHIYDESNYRTRNSYGFEIAIDENGIAIARGTLVDLPQNGFIISAHGTSATAIQKNIKIGDYILYEKDNKNLSTYRDTTLIKIISIRERILSAKEKILTSISEFDALNYQKIELLYNDIVKGFNNLIKNYNSDTAEELNVLASNLHYMIIETKTVEVKAFWHYPMRVNGYPENSTEEVERFLNAVEEIGINTVYINTNFNGGAIYKSEYLKQLRGANYTYQGYNDYLECFISEAHKRKIRVVAWTNTHVCGDGYLPNHSKPEWVMLGYHGDNNSGNIYYYDITNPDVQNFLANVFCELASKYDLDGIEYDFIRYPSSNLYSFNGVITDASKVTDYGYNQGAIDLFKKMYNVDGDIKQLILNSPDVRSKWLDFKKNNVTKMVTLLSQTIREVNPNIMISAAVMTSLSGAIQTYSQDFGTWIKNGFVDNLDPMMYSASNSYVESRIESFIKTVDNNATIVVGLSPDNSGGDAVMLSEQIKIISRNLNIGWNEFSCRNIFSNKEILEGFKMIKRDYNVTRYDSKDEIRMMYAKHMLDLITNYYGYVDDTIDVDGLVKGYNLLYANIITIDELDSLFISIKNETIKNKLQNEYLYIKNLIME